MAENESKFWTASKTVGTLLGSIFTAVVAALLIHYFTQPPTYPQIGLTGIVSNGLTRQPIVDAQVTASSGTSIATVKTDTQGRYSFLLTGTPSGTQSVVVDILAGGYPFYRSTPLMVSVGDNYVAFPLVSTEAASPANPGFPPGPPPASSLSLRFRPQVLKVLPPNFSKPAVAEKLAPKP